MDGAPTQAVLHTPTTTRYQVLGRCRTSRPPKPGPGLFEADLDADVAECGVEDAELEIRPRIPHIANRGQGPRPAVRR